MADIIKLLPDHVANQIAAGEVVQRPASVVKELIENAVDAKATHIKLIIKDSGKTLIQVIDNGTGMSTTDARLAFERHATSKITSAEDLFQLNTKGFRGEALASIAAIAHVELKTKRAEDEIGIVIKIEGSEVLSQEVSVIPTGTSISVKNLFYNIPARRNFLKSNQVELRHIVDEFHRVVLAHPTITFTLLNNGSELFLLQNSNLKQRIAAVFGGKTNEKLIPVNEETPIVSITGFIVKPEFAKKSRGEQFFFVNNRYIKSSYLHHAVVNAFDGLLKENAQPGYFLFLEVDPKSIDINIHPTKTEVKFDDEHTLYAMLRSALKHSLGQFNVTPVLDFDRDKNLDTPYEYRNKGAKIPQIEVDRDFNPFKGEIAISQKKSSFILKKETAPAWESLYSELNDERLNTAVESENLLEIEVESDEVAAEIFNENEIKTAYQFFQFQNKYIVFPVKDTLYFIHQQAAHERILYEGFLKNITVKEAASQQLLFPLELTFTSVETALINEVKEQLQNTGFGFESIDKETIVINGIPTNVEQSKVRDILEKLIDELQHEIPDNSFSQNDVLAKSLAASLSIKSGIVLNKEQQEYIISSLFTCKEPSLSPRNKRTFVTVSSSEVENKF